ncbi:hypothetical protein FB451DRAFT_1268726 [Mycena latifolia]|nr:hypothetical protein FB451DRAFT_1268726 [Mycena latifolia]
MVFVTFQILALVALATQFVTAAPAPELVTLVAGFPAPLPSDPTETFSASIVGVDSSNAHTTYAITQAVLSGDSSGISTVGFVTGTLVEGSNTVSYTLTASADSFAITAEADFGLQSGNIVATGLDSASHTVTTTFPAASFRLWVLDLPPTGAPSGPQPTGKSNSAQRTAAAGLGALVSLVGVWQLV